MVQRAVGPLIRRRGRRQKGTAEGISKLDL